MNRSAEIRSKRNDLSPFLFHYTKNFETLKLIVQQMRLKANLNYICFTEAPLVHSIELFRYFHSFQPNSYYPNLKPMYEPYGIGISREFLFNKGARPLIYCSLEELNLLPVEFKWRSMELNMVEYDLSWLREWRINGHEFDFSDYRNEIIVITLSEKELKEICADDLFDVDFSYEHEIGECIPSINAYKKRIFKGIAIQNIVQNSFISDLQIKYYTSKQEFDEIIE